MAKKRKRILLSWSGGKDSAVSLFELKSPEFEVLGLLSVFTEHDQRLQMHRLDRSLVEEQARSCELPLYSVFVPEKASNLQYESALNQELKVLKEKLELDGIAFGDISLADVKAYRENLLKSCGLKGIFPLWGWDPQLVNQAFTGLGHQGIVHCIQSKALPPAFLGRPYNSSFVDDLPKNVHPCGEKGEFHTFVFDGPFFQHKVYFEIHDRYEEEGFSFLDLSLKKSSSVSHN